MAQAQPTDTLTTLRHPLLYMLLLVAGCTFALMYIPQPLLPSMGAEFGVSDSSVALIITFVVLPLAIAPIAYGALLHKYSPMRVLVVCGGIFALLGLPFALAQNFSLALTMRFMQGLLAPAILTTVMSCISDNYRGQLLQKALAIYIAISVGGSLFGRLWGGVFAWLFDWRTAYWLFSLFMLLCLVPLARWNAKPHAVKTYKKAGLADFRQALGNAGVRWGILVECCNFFVFLGFTNTLPFRIMELTEGKASSLQISLLYLGYALAVITAFLSGRLSRLLGGPGRAVVCALLGFIVALPLMLVPSPFVVFGALCLICIFQFLAHSIVPGLINRMAPGVDTGVVNGLYLAVYYMGGSLGTYVPSVLYSHFGWLSVICLFAFMLACALFAATRLRLYAPE